MRALRSLSCLACCFWLALGANRVTAEGPKTASAAKTKAPERGVAVQIGKSAAETRVLLEGSETESAIRIGGARAALPLNDAQSIAAENVKVSDGVNVAVVRVKHTRGESSALIARDSRGLPAILWVGRTDSHGDPGERTADSIEIVPANGSTNAQVVVGTYDERVRLCNESKTLLDARMFEAKSASLIPKAATRDDAAVAVETVIASETAPDGVAAAPVLKALRAVSSSNETPMHEARVITDENAATSWMIRDGAFATLRWELPSRAIRAFAITPGAPEPSGKARAALSFTLVGDHGQRVSVSVPAAVAASKTYWLVPKTPLTSACWSIVFDATSGAGAENAAIAEVAAYTDVDFAGGLAKLVGEAVSAGPTAGDAVEVLARAGEQATALLVDAWPRMTSQSRRRVVRAFGPRAGNSEAAMGLLDKGLRDADPDVSHEALVVASSALPKSLALLSAVATGTGTVADACATALAEHAPAESLPALLRALDVAGGTERPALREAIGNAARRAGNAGATAVQAWIQSGTAPLSSRVAAALALASVEAGRTAAGAIVIAALPEAKEFADQWRLVQAATLLPAEPATDAWLASRVASDAPWMLRAAALRALASRGSPSAAASARAALADVYPRVRVDALNVLAKAPDAFELLASTVEKDNWFLVRVAAVDGLATTAASGDALIKAVTDRSSIVRAAAIRGLRKQRAIAAWSAISPHVAEATEYPEVIAEGIAFAKALCVQDAGPTLREVVGRGLKPDAYAPDVDLALSSLAALIALGGEHAAWAIARSQLPIVPDPMRKEMQSAAKATTICQPTE